MLRLIKIFVTAIFLGLGITAPELAYAARIPAIALNGDQQAAVRRINEYINSFQTLKCNFSQVSSKGNISRGILYISKPGRLRFDYAPPNPLLIVADGKWLTIKDRAREKGDQFPLSATPLRLVVAPQVDLLAETDVIAFDQHDGLITVSLQDRKNNIGGYITLIFDEQLNKLQQWVVVDAKNKRTTVQLSDIQTGGRFDPKLFVGQITRQEKQK